MYYSITYKNADNAKIKLLKLFLIANPFWYVTFFVDTLSVLHLGSMYGIQSSAGTHYLCMMLLSVTQHTYEVSIVCITSILENKHKFEFLVFCVCLV